MDLHSGLPYWIVRNSLLDYFHPLEDDLSTDIVIVGSGITGALMAHELCRAGIECCVIDKRSIATGSSAASTALLQYEIDVPSAGWQNHQRRKCSNRLSCMPAIHF